jgi:hypothetical protein
MNARVDPFQNLDDFKPQKKGEKKPISQSIIDKVAEENNFPSRKAAETAPQVSPEKFVRPKRKRAPAASVQINVRSTIADAERFYALLDRSNLSLGELFNKMLDAYESKSAK